MSDNLIGKEYVLEDNRIYKITKVEIESTGHSLARLETLEKPVYIRHLYLDELVGKGFGHEEPSQQHKEDVMEAVERVMEQQRGLLDNLQMQEEAEKTGGALRYNSGKPPLSMIDPIILELTAQVLAFGAKKYARNNWKKGLEISSTMDSLLRHAMAFASGEDNDPESGVSHLGHIVCNAMFIAYYQKHGGKDER